MENARIRNADRKEKRHKNSTKDYCWKQKKGRIQSFWNLKDHKKKNVSREQRNVHVNQRRSKR